MASASASASASVKAETATDQKGSAPALVPDTKSSAAIKFMVPCGYPAELVSLYIWDSQKTGCFAVGMKVGCALLSRMDFVIKGAPEFPIGQLSSDYHYGYFSVFNENNVYTGSFAEHVHAMRVAVNTGPETVKSGRAFRVIDLIAITVAQGYTPRYRFILQEIPAKDFVHNITPAPAPKTSAQKY
jgi:hypothetical protein